jgi:hypothetical protein
MSENVRSGKGQLIWKNGTFYEGEWKEDKANGYGILVHPDGDVYKG